MIVKKVHQIIVTKEKLEENVLAGYTPVTQIGIQGAPGVVFQLNNGNNIQLGFTGIYQLDLEGGLGQIRSLVFTTIGDDDQVIVDIVYESQE